MQYARFGSISTGTLRTEDLLQAYADELDYQCDRNKGLTGNVARRKLIAEAYKVDPESENAGWIIEALDDELDEFAAPYSYFGAVEGDGADFGFWPDIESLEMAVSDGEVTKVNNLSDANDAGEYMIVNDHGNVMFGYVNGNGKFTETWSCV